MTTSLISGWGGFPFATSIYHVPATLEISSGTIQVSWNTGTKKTSSFEWVILVAGLFFGALVFFKFGIEKVGPGKNEFNPMGMAAGLGVAFISIYLAGELRRKARVLGEEKSLAFNPEQISSISATTQLLIIEDLMDDEKQTEWLTIHASESEEESIDFSPTDMSFEELVDTIRASEQFGRKWTEGREMTFPM